MNNYLLSVIIPYRLTEDRQYLYNRIVDLCNNIYGSKVEFIFIDSGSNYKKDEIKNTIEENKHTYIYHDTSDKIFSIGLARDFGAKNAKGKVVTFFDADLFVDQNFFNELVKFIQIKEVHLNPNIFFVIPCIYLSETGTQEFLQIKRDKRKIIILNDLVYGTKKYIQNMAPCSSVMVVNRHKYLSMGGHRPEFSGHGYEDFEFIHRMISSSNMFERRADDYYKDSKTWDNTLYAGFRSQFSVLGREAFYNGLFTVHLFHPRPNVLGYHTRSKFNHAEAIELFKKYDKDHFGPEPLVDSSCKNKKILFFGVPKSSATECIRELIPFMGNLIFTSEWTYFKNGFFQESFFELFIEYNHIDKILFPNPYANDARLSIYNWARRKQFPFSVFERGALPDSWFLDDNGFNADSCTYSEKEWNHHLSYEQKNDIVNYINTILNGDSFLEKQGDKVTGEGLKSRMNLTGKKILFVPLQRPSDTVVRFFSGNIISFDMFLNEIARLASLISLLGWVVVCKKHPLETKVNHHKNIIYANADTNIIDLLSMCDAVALINSGVGVYAAMLKKPCYIFGDAFYESSFLNKKVNSIFSVIDDMLNGIHSVDKEKMYSFIWYLKNKVYSFGKSSTSIRTEKDGSLRTITDAINFYDINFGNVNIKYKSIEAPKILLGGLAFEPFRYYLYRENEIKKEKLLKSTTPSKPTAKPTATPTAKPTATPTGKPTATPTGKDILYSGKMHSQKHKNRYVRLLKKLIKNPYMFFNDSKYKILRKISIVFSRK